jgi:hypothetical protein
MTGTTLDFAKHCKVPFGAYVETHEETKPTNTMVERTRGAICLGPSANFQGSYKLVCLRTGRKIIRKQFRELHMPASVINRFEAIALPNKRSGNTEFTDRNEIPIADDDENDNNPGDDLTEADTSGVNSYPDLDNTYNPPCLLIESEESDDDTAAYKHGHDDIPVIPEAVADNSSDNEGHDIPGVDPEDANRNDIPGVDPEEIPGVNPEETPGVYEDNDADADPHDGPPTLGPDVDSSDDEDSDGDEEEPENEDDSPEVVYHPDS